MDIKSFCEEAEQIMNGNKNLGGRNMTFKFSAVTANGVLEYEHTDANGNTNTFMDLRATGYLDGAERPTSFCYFSFKQGEIDQYSPRDLAFNALGMIAVDMQKRQEVKS